ncbi:MAG TPA: N-acyl homoserine lactonase family protein [Candidatus Limnocylindrales bacterium]|nr:N-acyl homoserine lactonase family protein [Candidatus Limnocylindrales bacterium]
MDEPHVIALPTGEFTFPSGEEYEGQTGVVVAYAIRHATGTFLFDTGFAPDGPELDEFYVRWQVKPRALDEVFAEARIDVAEVTAIANCHLHLDHSGQNARFPGVPIYVQRSEWTAAHEPDYTYLPAIDFPGATYVPLDGEAEPVRGMWILPTPGHSPGHQSLVIERPEGLLLLAGQAVYTRGEWLGLPNAKEGASTARDRSAYDRSIARLRSLHPAEVLFGHDRQGWP